MTRNKENHPVYQNIKVWISPRNQKKGEEWIKALTEAQEEVLEAAADLYDVAIKMPHAYMEIIKLVDDYKFYPKIETEGGIEKFGKNSLYYEEYQLSAFIKDKKYEAKYDGYFQAGVDSVASKALVFVENAAKSELNQKIKWKDDKEGLEEIKIIPSNKKNSDQENQEYDEEKTDQESESTEQKLKRPLPDPQQPTKSILKKPKVSGLGD